MTRRSRSRARPPRRSRPMLPLAEPYDDPYADGWPPVLPPLMRGMVLSPADDPVAAAARAAASAGDGAEAGLVCLAPAPGSLGLAITLVPDVPLGSAIQMAHALLLAAGDAIGALAPPEVGVTCRWPAILLVNGGAAGRVRVAAPDRARDAVPAWLVIGLDLRLLHDGADEPGHAPGETSLFEEGAGALPAGRLAESVTRHFLSWLYRWESDGFAPLRDAWNGRAESRVVTGGRSAAGLDAEGRTHAGDPDGPPAAPLDLLDIVETGHGR